MIFDQKERAFRRRISAAAPTPAARAHAIGENAPQSSINFPISAILMVVLGKKVVREGER